jgi:broad specificity phosphatase PhoE
MVGVDGRVLVLVRHGENERVPRDGPLTERGRDQVTEAARAVGVGADDVLVSSPMLRARQTAHAFGRPFWVIDELAEFRCGPDWVRDRTDQTPETALWRAGDRAGDESLAEFQTRVDGALRKLVERDETGRLVLSVHSGVIDAALRWAFGVPPDAPWITEADVAHASVTELRHWPTGRDPHGAPRHTVIVRVGDTGHLAADLVTGR